MSDKQHFIELFRAHGFNCFPIPQYPDSEPEPKKADGRYSASTTTPNQPIGENENYGVIALKDAGTCFIDLDHKELYRAFAEEFIAKGFMVIETPNGWHIPCEGLTGTIKKMMFYDLDVEPNKQIVEIQGFDHYVIGAGCSIWNNKKGQRGYYESKGTERIWNAEGADFNKFCDTLCRKVNVKPKTLNKSANYNQRQRFKEGKPPTRGTSNFYFYNAAIQCLSDGLTIHEAKTKIEAVYDKWVNTDTFSGRTWSNIEDKINDAYENGEPLTEGRPAKQQNDTNLVTLCQKIVADRKIYSDEVTDEIWENIDGYLENITNRMHKQLQQTYPEMTKDVLNEIKFRIVGLAPDLPETNKNFKVFDNGVYDEQTKQLIETDEIAAMGFKGYNYLPPDKENIPEKFIKIVFGNVNPKEHGRLKAGLKAALSAKLDPRISVIHGKAGTGKSLGMEILFKVMNVHEEYALTLELDQLLTDSFIKAKIKGKTLLVLTDLPEQYKDFSKLKAITGEGVKTERAFYADATSFENKLKIFATTNYLAKIPTKEKNAMYRRLSLIHNTREISYEVNPDLADEVVEEEGEKIISWILNIPDSECSYETPKDLKGEWEGLASPEVEYMETYWQMGDTTNEISVMRLRKDFEEKYETSMTHTQFADSLKEQGYYINKNMVANIIPIVKKVDTVKGQQVKTSEQGTL